jgi:hypothetical protein
MCSALRRRATFKFRDGLLDRGALVSSFTRYGRQVRQIWRCDFRDNSGFRRRFQRRRQLGHGGDRFGGLTKRLREKRRYVIGFEQRTKAR